MTRFAILRQAIVDHPWEALAVACLAGAIVRLDRSGRARRLLISTLGSAAMATIANVLSPQDDVS